MRRASPKTVNLNVEIHAKEISHLKICLANIT